MVWMQISLSLDTEIHVKLTILIHDPEQNCFIFALQRHSVSKLVNVFLPMAPSIIKLNNLVVFIQSPQSVKFIQCVDHYNSLE